MTDTYPPGSRFVAYLRASPGNSQVLSTERQRADITRWCDERAYSVVTWFEDDNRRGGSVVGREQFWALMTYLEKQPDIVGVLVAEPSRWARNYDESQYYTASVRLSGYAFVSIDDPAPDTPIGRVIESLQAAYAEEETRRLAMRIKSGIYAWRQKAKTAHGKVAPTGYRFERIVTGQNRNGALRYGRKLVIDPATAPKVQRAFELAAQGYSLVEILQRSGLDGIIVTQTVGRILSNPIYIGIGRAKGGSIEGICEPLVSKELFYRVAQVRKEQQERYATKTRNPRKLLSGIIVCHNCGDSNSVSYGAAGRHYYRCQNVPSRRPGGTCTAALIDGQALEADVLRILRDLLDDPETIREVYVEIERRREQQTDHQTQVEAQRAVIADLDRRTKTIVRQLERLDAAGDASGALLTRLVEVERDAVTERETLARLEAVPPAPPDPAGFEQMRAGMLAALDNAPTKQQALLLRALHTRVSVARKPGSKRSDDYFGSVEFEIDGVKIRREL